MMLGIYKIRDWDTNEYGLFNKKFICKNVAHHHKGNKPIGKTLFLKVGIMCFFIGNYTPEF